MMACVFRFDSWAGKLVFFFKSSTPKKLYEALNEVQDLECLAEMGYANEGVRGREQLNSIKTLIDHYRNDMLTFDDFSAVKSELSIGSFECLDVADGEDAVNALEQQYPKAMKSVRI